MASAEAAAGPDQTVVLKVSIHCHGCKKKVRKVLRSVEGVKNVTVDAAQHKVTVTGTIDAATLIKRLYKSGKQAQPWWQCHAPAETPKKPAPAPEALPAPAAQPAPGDGAAAADKKPEEPVKEPKAQAEGSEKKKPEQEAGASSEKKPEAEPKNEEKEEAKKVGGESEAAEPKAKGAEAAKEAVADATKEAGNEEDDVKKSKNDKPKDAGGAQAQPVVMAERSLSGPPVAAPRHAYEEYPHPYYSSQPVMSYNMAQRSASVSYFAPQPQAAYSMQQPEPQPQPQTAYPAYSMQQSQPQAQPMQQWSPSYLYMPYPHSAPEPYYHDYYSPPGTHASPPPMQDSYRLFDDENPNSCSVM